jgi:hypothetical protein
VISHPEAVRSALLTVSGMGHRAFPRRVGLFSELRTGEKVSVGVKGEADISGTLRGGWSLYIEVKTGNATRTRRQVAFGKAMAGLGACYLVARYSDCECGDTAIRAAIESFLEQRQPQVRGAAA